MERDIENLIHEKLTTVLKPEVLKITNDSEKHHNHPGALPGKDTHFRIKIASRKFEGLSHLEKHRLVYDVLSDEMKGTIHSLSVTIVDVP
jgi:BolA protein